MNIKTIGKLFLLAGVLSACGDTPPETASTTSQAPAVAAQTGQVAGMGDFAAFVGEKGDRVFFDFNKADIKPDAQNALKRQAEWLNANAQINVVVEGHCDERGSVAYNMALGQRRADASKNYLGALGVQPTRIETISYGKGRPAAEGHDEAAWSQNRRAVTVLK